MNADIVRALIANTLGDERAMRALAASPVDPNAFLRQLEVVASQAPQALPSVPTVPPRPINLLAPGQAQPPQVYTPSFGHLLIGG